MFENKLGYLISGDIDSFGMSNPFTILLPPAALPIPTQDANVTATAT